MALDQNLSALLTESVNYYPRTGVNADGQTTWATNPTVLKCYPAFGSEKIDKPDGTVYVSTQALYFDASNATVQGFQLGDKFQSIGIGGGQTMEAVRIEPNYSPGPSFGAPMQAWLVEVSL